jgi:predicted nucleic acid-binding protein
LIFLFWGLIATILDCGRNTVFGFFYCPIAEADCQIAAIARASDAPVATRNGKDFEGCGIGLIDPWGNR